MKYSTLVTSSYVSVMNLETGNVVKFQRDDPKFETARDLMREGKFEAVEAMSVKNQVQEFLETPKASPAGVVVKLDGGLVKYSVNGSPFKPLVNTMVNRILKMVEDGFDATPLLAFMSNLMQNPSKTSIDELYLFLEATDLPITSDGHFIAYKMVNGNYTSIHDGTFMNAVGTVVEMPRFEVDDNRNELCSTGLHFCSKEYLTKFGYGSDKRLVLVKINPADVVSIPADYNNAKGRASKYLIWKDITAPGWREKFSEKDFNDKSVEVMDDDEDILYEDHYEDGDLDSGHGEDPLVVHVTNIPPGSVTCPECHTTDTHRKCGTRAQANGQVKQRYMCTTCGRNFTGEVI